MGFSLALSPLSSVSGEDPTRFLWGDNGPDRWSRGVGIRAPRSSRKPRGGMMQSSYCKLLQILIMHSFHLRSVPTLQETLHESKRPALLCLPVSNISYILAVLGIFVQDVCSFCCTSLTLLFPIHMDCIALNVLIFTILSSLLSLCMRVCAHVCVFMCACVCLRVCNVQRFKDNF